MEDVVFLFENTVEFGSKDLEIIEESQSNDGSQKIAFKTKLQTANEVNGNRRWYSNNVCRSIVDVLNPKAKNRSLYQEIDHPFISQDGDKRRALIVELKNCGSLVRRIYMEGNDVLAEIETLSGFCGPDLRDLIVKDKANIGFSLRMFSRLGQHPTLPNVSEVKGPLRPITYDIVTDPSHKKARILNFISESKNFISDDESLIEECMTELLRSGENFNQPDSSKEIYNDYLNLLVKESFKNCKSFIFNFS